MAETRQVIIKVTYLPTDVSWQSKIYNVTEEGFDDIQTSLDDFTQGVSPNLFFEDPGGELHYFNTSILEHAVVTLML